MEQVEPEPKEQAEERKQDTVEVSTGKAAQVLVREEETYSPSDFHDNDNKVLELLNESGSNYTFKGLMRKLNLHQQSLSRALHRLQEMGLVERTALGYKVGSVKTQEAGPKARGIEYTQLLQTYIPVGIKPGVLVRLLAGKWFGKLRWLGMIDSSTGFTLQWANEDGSFQINLKLISDYVIIETNARTEKEKLLAMAGSYAIFEQITKALQGVMANAIQFGRRAENN